MSTPLGSERLNVDGQPFSRSPTHLLLSISHYSLHTISARPEAVPTATTANCTNLLFT